MKSLLCVLALSSSAFSANILLQGSSDRGYPDLAYDPVKPPSATTALGTAFPEPSTGGSITRTFRVVNLDPAFGSKLNVSAVSSDPRFVISGLSSSISPSSSDDYQITFTPTDTTTASATITFTTNDPARPSYAFDVSGAPGTYSARFENQAGDSLTNSAPANTPTIFADTTYGPVSRGSSAVSKTYKLVNTGSLPISFLSVRLFGDAAFRSPTLGLDQIETPTVAPGEEYAIEIVMDTDVVLDDARATIRAAANETSPAVFAFTVAGFVSEAPDILLERLVGSWGAIGASDDFGVVATGESVTRSYRVRNSGGEPLTLSAVEVTDADMDFQINGIAPGTLAPGESDSFSVTFTPTRGGPIDTTLAITSDAISGPVTTLTLVGTGLLPPAPDLSVWTYLGEPGSGLPVAFGSIPSRHEVAIGDSADETILIRNDGTGRATLDSLVLSDGYSVVGSFPASVAAGESVYLTIRFEPDSVGFFPLTLELTSASLPEPLVATRSNRGQGLPRTGEVGLAIVAITEDTVELIVDATPLATQSSFRIGSGTSLQQWGVASATLTLSDSVPTPVSVSRTGPVRFFRVERIGNLE